jgi:N-acetylglucosaminyldiphosphoundecaprenol N-acetyl-beta-D-mannosaminyltransferase
MSQQILGLHFFDGAVGEAVDRALDRPGLVVAPSGTCFTRLREDARYRRAVSEADLVLPDSGFMVLLWRLLRGRRITRISGLAYWKEMLARPELRHRLATFWILPNEEAREKTGTWLAAHEFVAEPDDFYVAPIYGPLGEDKILLSQIESRRPRHVVIALSGGVQEKLGFFLRETSGYRPAIHCIGGALGFVTGYQRAIPDWADRLYLGWLLRLLSNPRRFLPRALNALALPYLIIRHGEEMPPLAD